MESTPEERDQYIETGQWPLSYLYRHGRFPGPIVCSYCQREATYFLMYPGNMIHVCDDCRALGVLSA